MLVVIRYCLKINLKKSYPENFSFLVNSVLAAPEQCLLINCFFKVFVEVSAAEKDVSERSIFIYVFDGAAHD